MTNGLFEPTAPGPLALQNRIAMAPMTRTRAPGNVPNALMADYYRQRNSAGLIITEGTSPSPEGLGYTRIPGLFNQAQAEGWSKIADAAHTGGAKLVVQLMHTGRVAAYDNLPEGARALAPSAIRAAGQIWSGGRNAMVDHDEPKAMDEADIRRVQADFARAATLAIGAGVDGVEIHAANGYLPNQFLNPKANARTDRYGGSAENRQRFLLEIVDQTIAAIGRERVGVRISPFNSYNDLAANYPGEREDYLQLVNALAERGIGYLHLIATPGAVPDDFVDAVRAAFKGTLILAGGFDRARAEAELAAGRADVIAFARPFVGNPDLPERFRLDKPLAGFDANLLYAPGPDGYNDYPTWEQAPRAA